VILNALKVRPLVSAECHESDPAYAATHSSLAGHNDSRGLARSAHLKQTLKDRLKHIAHRSWADGAILGEPSKL